ncbi:dienelactone hydrolase domain-containing protein [Fusarium denticulatum]|uniref:Dienelactone hydrolase domain-containing protein n=1 Tax=Fusarium denticulatum TaxID=48507 RepID=A0A8H5TLI5_9HYPO|nr:dienelactone hydrolase domain-containing protein [Fusarium denticulatum]
MSTIIQNTSTPKTVSFPCGGDHIAGHLYLPENLDPNQRYPAVVVGGSMASVKEMMAGTYAAELARRGVIGLAVDYRNYGQSGGAFRQREDPESKAADLAAAIKFLSRRPDVAGTGLLGICTSAGNVLYPAASDPSVKAVATVAGFFPSASVAPLLHGGEEVIKLRRAQGQEATKLYNDTQEIKLIKAYGGSANESASPGQKPYYEDVTRGNIRQWRNEFAVASWEAWIGWDPVEQASLVQAPTLIIHSEKAAFPDQARMVYSNLKSQKEIVWMEGAHYDFYDDAEVVRSAADKLAQHFHTYIK